MTTWRKARDSGRRPSGRQLDVYAVQVAGDGDAGRHRRDLERLCRQVEEIVRPDPRFLALLAFGSWASGRFDACSDLDLVLVSEPSHHGAVLHEGPALAESVGGLLTCFTGEHVGEPRLLICLYGPDPLLHCDLKFVVPDDLRVRIQEPEVIWERDRAPVSAVLRSSAARFPAPDSQWIEDRFWVWIHYAATKLRRGELFEVVDVLAFVRQRVLGPLVLQERDLVPNGVRRLELDAPDAAAILAETIARHEPGDCHRAVRRAAEIYRAVRAHRPPPQPRTAAERAALAYLDES